MKWPTSCLECGDTHLIFFAIPPCPEEPWALCNKHRNPKGSPDVFFDGKPEHGLADDPRTGQPIVFQSKSAKAAYLKERGLMEAGDRVRGSYPSVLGQPKRDTRPEVREALHKVRQMSPDRRHQEFLRIRKGAGV